MEETIPPLRQRGALIIAIVDGEDNMVAENANYLLSVPKTLEAFSPLLTLLPLHLLSVFIAVECIKNGYQRPENSI
jgi:glucosamine--fructose-6-phosphate aminotransferase (isomerizing)